MFVLENKNVSVFKERIETIQAQEEVFLIQAEEVASNTFDLLYQKKGKWILERLVVSPYHVYLFQTSSEDLFSDNHEIFINSLHVKSIS